MEDTKKKLTPGPAAGIRHEDVEKLKKMEGFKAADGGEEHGTPLVEVGAEVKERVQEALAQGPITELDIEESMVYEPFNQGKYMFAPNQLVMLNLHNEGKRMPGVIETLNFDSRTGSACPIAKVSFCAWWKSGEWSGDIEIEVVAHRYLQDPSEEELEKYFKHFTEQDYFYRKDEKIYFPNRKKVKSKTDKALDAIEAYGLELAKDECCMDTETYNALVESANEGIEDTHENACIWEEGETRTYKYGKRDRYLLLKALSEYHGSVPEYSKDPHNDGSRLMTMYNDILLNRQE